MNNKNKTAFPAFPAQDNFGKIFTPFGGQTFYEYVLLQFSAQLSTRHIIPTVCVDLAAEYTEAYFNKLSELNNQPHEQLKIIQE